MSIWTGDLCVLDISASLVVDAQILANLVDFDRARPIVLHDHRALDVGGINTARSVGLDDKGSGDVADVDVARAVFDSDVAADVLDGEVARSVRDPNSTGRADHRQRAR